MPLRVFLGATFVYAGLQKLADRWFFKASAPSSLQSQLRGAARTSPIGGLVHTAGHYAVLLGVAIAFGELAIGLATLLGLWARPAAAAGLLLSLGFLLTVSWHSRPYYYGADIVFVFAWTPLLLGGPGPLSLDTKAAARTRADLGMRAARPVTIGFESVQRLCGSYERGRCAAQGGRRCGPGGCPVLAPVEAASMADELDRRTFLRRIGWAGWVAVSAVIAGGSAALAGRLIGPGGRAVTTAALGPQPGAATPPTGPADSTPVDTAPQGAAPPTAAPPTTAASTTTATVAGTEIGLASAVPVGGAASFSDPNSGDPAFVVQPSPGRFVAFDAACPHQGCPVRFTGSQFQCPCHGAAFDAATGAVLRGPARRPLTTIRIQEGPDGKLYVV